jgi:hypothetical protein
MEYRVTFSLGRTTNVKPLPIGATVPIALLFMYIKMLVESTVIVKSAKLLMKKDTFKSIEGGTTVSFAIDTE